MSLELICGDCTELAESKVPAGSVDLIFTDPPYSKEGNYPFTEGRLLCYNRRNARRWVTPVTVCIAAMCANGIIFGASDRMITSGDIQFEPQQTKLILLTSSIVAQLAGDASVQAEIMQRVGADIFKRVKDEPNNWWSVLDVAELYRHYYEEARLRRAEHELLAPLGLDRNTWVSKQKEMDTGLVRQLATELINYELPGCAAIFSGVDTTGTHIYVADGGEISCQDSVGFAAIGAGAGHANSQFMFAGHTRYKPIPETLLLVFSAKKRAEVAPGVGEASDMFAVGPSLGTYVPIPDDVLKGLGQTYDNEQKSHRKAAEKAREEVDGYLKEITKQPATDTQAPTPLDGGGDAPTN